MGHHSEGRNFLRLTFICIGGNRRFGQEPEPAQQIIDGKTFEPDDPGVSSIDKFFNCRSRHSGHDEEGVKLIAQHLAGCWARFQILDDQVAFGQVVRRQKISCDQQGSRPRLVDRNPMALQIRHGLDVAVYAHDQLQPLGIEAGHHAKLLRRAEIGERTGTMIGIEHHVRLREAAIDRAGLDVANIGDRTVR